MVIYDGGLLHGTSLYGLLKFLIYILSDHLETADQAAKLIVDYQVINLYTLFGIIAGILCLLLALVARDNSSKILIISSMIILLHLVNAHYKLVLLIFALVIFLAEKKLLEKNDKILFWLINLVIVPKPYIWFRFKFNPVGITLNSLLNPVLILLILIFIFVNELSRIEIKNFHYKYNYKKSKKF